MIIITVDVPRGQRGKFGLEWKIEENSKVEGRSEARKPRTKWHAANLFEGWEQNSTRYVTSWSKGCPKPWAARGEGRRPRGKHDGIPGWNSANKWSPLDPPFDAPVSPDPRELMKKRLVDYRPDLSFLNLFALVLHSYLRRLPTE